jgi:hypothetical protein
VFFYVEHRSDVMPGRYHRPAHARNEAKARAFHPAPLRRMAAGVPR